MRRCGESKFYVSTHFDIPFRSFCSRSLRFMQHYHDGLNGAEAAWAAKKYSSHRVLPPGIILERADAATSA
ncbi:uncharacterized protein BXZ73DRAFT_61922 [Epithele typhae]|uniref:uncharacterized protein n=1 Tax=Epithele typhae TaxID=378194 RepID=UPI002008B130|nr:uncharacterized protein BXZ73DRAFT_61922 [Epithele typhae]KAH9904639.1 hypothetical protein BXZ73DRAFT_61922 [Epithele typhae]